MYKILTLLLLGTCMTFQAQNVAIDSTSNSKDWGFYIAPYVLFAAQATDVGGERIRQSFNDLTSITNSGFQLVGGVKFKRWNAWLDGTFAHLSYHESRDFIDLDLKIVQTILDLRLGYDIYENLKYSASDVMTGWSIQLNAGTKYWRNDLGIDYVINIGDSITIEDSIEEIQRWWDLMLGMRLDFILSKRVLLGVSGSVGGFGIGNSNDFSYDFTYTNSFIIKDYLWINAGFRSFKYNRTDGTGENEIKTTVHVLGPLLGVTFKI